MEFSAFGLKLEIGDVFYIPCSCIGDAFLKNVTNPFDEDNVIYCVVNEIVYNKMSGEVINGEVFYKNSLNEKTFEPYSNNNKIDFKWALSGKITKSPSHTRDELIKIYPHKFV